MTIKRTSGYILLLLLTSWYIPGFSQNAQLDQSYTATYVNATLKEVLSDITDKTKIRFSYSPKKISEDTRINLTFVQTPLYDVLDKVFKTIPIKYEVVDNYIVLKKGNIEIPEPDAPTAIKKYTFSGYIKDNSTSEYLIGASIYIKELNLATTTNNYGFFSLTMPPGKYSMEVSYVGYEHIRQTFEIKSNLKLDYQMDYTPIKLAETIIPSLQKDDMSFKLHAGQMTITPTAVERQPSLMGEPDVIKSLGYLPGVVFNGDGSSYFHVRGGNYDQNLIILDEATIFNPSHLLGLFSPIIPDAIKKVDVYKADYPVNFGGRLSSVIDIHTKDGNKNKVIVTGSLGLISTRATIEGPIKKEASSFFISFRQSYFDAYIKPSAPSLNGLYFNDFTSKFNLKLGAKDRLFITLYAGTDVLSTKLNTDDSNGINWGNQSFTLRWNHVFGSQTFLSSSFYTSKYDYYLNTSTKANEYWNSRITNATLKEELSFFASPTITWRYGLKISAYGFNPGNYFSPKNTNNIQVSTVNSIETVLYAGAEQELFPWLKLNYGLRLTSWANTGKAFVVQYDSIYDPTGVKYYSDKDKFYQHYSLEPRLSTSIKTGHLSSIKASYSRTNQYLNLISNSISPFNSLEVWLPAGPNIKPQYADIVDIGYSQSIGSFDLQTDVYYKWMYNQLGYKYHASMLVNPLVEGELRQGKGWSYGFEVSIKKETGKLTGQLNYTYSRAFLNIKDLNADRNFPASFDRPHSLSLCLAFQPQPRWMLSTDYNISSGARITTPTAFYYYRGYQVPIYTEQNNDRLPLYRRFDVSATYQLNKLQRRFNHSLTLAILNLAGRQNHIFLYFNKYKDASGKLVIPMDRLNQQELTTTIRYTYGFLPSLTYQFRF